jgi:AhpD family alkylhydroperoxidase
MSQSRRSLPEIAPDAYRAIRGVETYIRGCGLDKLLVHLVRVRASQINGCAFCINMHTSEARQLGETEQRLYLLNAWREAQIYSDRERAALAWTEHLTRLSVHGAPAVEYERLRGLFSEVEVSNLTALIGLINLWNRVVLGGGFHLTTAEAA